MLAGATMLLSLPQDSPWAIPSKIFEYMQFDAWMLVLAEPDAPAALLLRDSGADVVSPADVDAIAAVLKRRIEEFRRGERPRRLAHERMFSRRVQAERLMDELGRCISSRPSSSRQALESRTAGRVIAGVSKS
jgi:glycosyltransferase involved in cell wall biosynthesis